MIRLLFRRCRHTFDDNMPACQFAAAADKLRHVAYAISLDAAYEDDTLSRRADDASRLIFSRRAAQRTLFSLRFQQRYFSCR